MLGRAGGGHAGAGRAAGERRTRIVALVLAALLVACTATRPAPTPADSQVIFEELARRGATVTGIVSGDPGCDERELVDNAIRFRLAAPGAGRAAVYLLIFRHRAAFEESAASVERCVEALGAAAGEPVDRLDLRPYRAYGPAWSDRLRELLRETLAELSGGS